MPTSQSSISSYIFGISLLSFMLICALPKSYSQAQIEIDSAENGILIKDALLAGLAVINSQTTGVFVQNSGNNGFQVSNAGLNGLEVLNAFFNGVHVGTAEENGLHIENAYENGVQIDLARNNGVIIDSAFNDGIYVKSAGRYGLNIQGKKSLDTKEPADHIAQIYNTSNNTSPDVLSLKVGRENPGTGVNFITFYGGSSAVGAIEGTLGGITLKSGSADFAEMLPVLDPKEIFEAGDIVALRDGQISKDTRAAHQVMVITDRPIVLGNQQDDETDYEKVSFIGQVPVKVIGDVAAGDWIVAAGQHDGIGIAKSSAELLLEDHIVGQALESNTNPKLKSINTLVGLDHSQAIKDHLLSTMQSEIDQLKAQVKMLIDAIEVSAEE